MQTTLITGIGRGIGKALAQKFLKEGYAVMGTSQTGSVDYQNPNLKVFQLDLASPESIKECAEQVTKSGAKIDILINNAAILLDRSDTHVIVDKLRKTLEVNVVGTIEFTELILGELDNDGHIVNISSASGSLTDEEYADKPNDSHHNLFYKTTRSAADPYEFPSYKISKCALNMYTCILAELMKHEKTNIIVSSVSPGWVKTDMGGKDAPTTPEEAAENIYKLAISRPETGQFWFNGKKYPW